MINDGDIWSVLVILYGSRDRGKKMKIPYVYNKILKIAHVI